MTIEWIQRALCVRNQRLSRGTIRPLGQEQVAALLLFLATFFAASSSAAAATPEQLAFFEKKIRPVLVEHCYACHSEKAEKTGQLKGGLRLDTRAAALQGGDSGPAVVPGDVDNSLLVSALKYDGFEMPPKGRLPDAVIADFQTWIREGAVDPRTGSATKRTEIDIAEGRKHWSYQLPRRATAPAVVDRAWPLDAVDAYLLHSLEAKSLSPAGEASRAALARRLSYDLLGLPPDAETLAEFIEDPAPDAFERLVDRWLASPRFGERWGRHWLDVARYAESITLRGFVLPDAWRYRDYVIETFNSDRPLDEFLREQIAGDVMPTDDMALRQRRLIATSYLALGNTNLEEQDKKQLRMDYVDEQLDVIGKGLLAQTITCARCHDHKFDPISTRDYYALAGIFRSVKAMEHSNVSKWIEVPLPLAAADEAVYREHEGRVAALDNRVKKLREAIKLAGASAKSPAGEKVVAVSSLAGIVIDDAKAKRVGMWQDSKVVRPFVGEGYAHDQDDGKGDKTVTFQPEITQSGQYEVRLAYTTGENRSTSAPVTIFSADGEKTIRVDQRQPGPIDGLWVSLGIYRFETNGQGFVIVSNEGTQGHVVVDAVQFLPQGAAAATTGGASASGVAGRPAGTPDKNAAARAKQDPAPTAPSKPDTAASDPAQVEAAKSALQADMDLLKKLEGELKQLQQSGPRRPMVLSVREEQGDEIGDTRVHVRGLVNNLGPSVPRGVLQVALYDEAPQMPEDQSGRRQLADWLASTRNPLPSRVLANRTWHWLFGEGLSRTPDNFGTTGEAPSHLELLDQLALDLMADGWSLKQLVRRLATTRAYRLSTEGSEQLAAADPENRLLGRAHRRRLDAEALVDTMLWASGELDLTTGGPILKPGLAADYGYQHDSRRRAVYWPVLRNVLPEAFEAFDFADPSLVTGRRTTSTVAPQALFLRNHPFVWERAKRAADRLLAETPTADDSERVERLYRRLVGREPSSREREATLDFVRESSLDRLSSWSLAAQALMSTIDFRFQ